MRFRITWHNSENGSDDYIGYKVSTPNYDGGEVVTIEEVEEIEDALKVVREKLDVAARNILELQRQLRALKGEDEF